MDPAFSILFEVLFLKGNILFINVNLPLCCGIFLFGLWSMYITTLLYAILSFIRRCCFSAQPYHIHKGQCGGAYCMNQIWASIH